MFFAEKAPWGGRGAGLLCDTVVVLVRDAPLAKSLSRAVFVK